ncbi:DUF4386 domain-containing protein [Nocardioides guangzhouensis]|uniref:DUF4386 domain-containing protein n=1 Tax=Nocardioides guangzhouensis TaxID=2497878 RepID=A0A4Q4ZDZ1_9ACTN|nr:DUF4386 domain-containing protein [Nocardioides guangzhouensis]RYP86263.1 DUF4386 domain-containing protein [Nocardioides guangzhouensis]
MATIATGSPTTRSDGERHHRWSVARITGLAYLGLAACGLTGQLIRNELDAPDAAGTRANLVAHEGLARLGIAADLGSVLTQALVAVGFFVLFRHVHAVAAACVTAFGLVNAAMILVATVFSTTALDTALGGGAGSLDRTMLLSDLQHTAWLTGGLFFGLWLIPMGWLAVRSGSMPRVLGWTLVAGGVGYVLSTYAQALLPDTSWPADLLLVPATVAELWMIGYLLLKGIADAGDPVDEAR